MKQIKQPFSWKVYLIDSNTDSLVTHDVLKYREKLIKDLKKKCTTKEDFADKLFLGFMSQYWSRCEYEMLIYIENEKVFAKPWICREPEKHISDVTNLPDFDWLTFAKQAILSKGCNGTAKIDVYDQLMFRRDELVDFCWNYRHKYQRKNK